MKLVAALVASIVAVAAGAATVKVTLSAPTHTPKIGVHWPYTVRVTSNGKAVAGRITVQVVDPTGTAHTSQFGRNSKYIRNWPFKGVFRDFIVWPASSQGVPLTFRVTVVAAHAKKVIKYRVTSHA